MATSFDEVLLDPLYSADAEGGPEWATAVVRSGSGGVISYRAETLEDYRSKYEIMFGELSTDRRAALRNFAILRKGMARGFRFLAPDIQRLGDVGVSGSGENAAVLVDGELVRLDSDVGTDIAPGDLFYIVSKHEDAYSSYVRRHCKISPYEGSKIEVRAADGSELLAEASFSALSEGSAIPNTRTAVTTGDWSDVNCTLDYWAGTVSFDTDIDAAYVQVACTVHIPVCFSDDWQKFRVDVAAQSEFRVSLEELLPKELGIV